jgi:TusA-related sulfurtransferase
MFVSAEREQRKMSEFLRLDLRGVACPMNFVKAKLSLDKLEEGAILEVVLDAGEPVTNVFASMVADGHQVDEPKPLADGSFELQIKKAEAPCIDKKTKV